MVAVAHAYIYLLFALDASRAGLPHLLRSLSLLRLRRYQSSVKKEAETEQYQQSEEHLMTDRLSHYSPSNFSFFSSFRLSHLLFLSSRSVCFFTSEDGTGGLLGCTGDDAHGAQRAARVQRGTCVGLGQPFEPPPSRTGCAQGKPLLACLGLDSL